MKPVWTFDQVVAQLTNWGGHWSPAASVPDWLWRLTHASCPGTLDVCAEAWLLSGDRVAWTLSASDAYRAVYMDNGAIFTEDGRTTYLAKEPIIADTVFGNTGNAPYYGLWLRSLDASTYTSITGTGSHQVYFSLIGNYLRTDASVYRVRHLRNSDRVRHCQPGHDEFRERDLAVDRRRDYDPDGSHE